MIQEAGIKGYSIHGNSNINTQLKEVIFSKWLGRCFTAKIPIASYRTKIKIHLVPRMYKIFIYDPNYFVGSNNPSGVPTIKFDLNMYQSNATAKQMIGVKKMYLLNRRKHKCVDYEEPYMDCVMRSIIKKVGCQLKSSWTISQEYGYPYCSSLDEIRMHFDLRNNITGDFF